MVDRKLLLTALVLAASAFACRATPAAPAKEVSADTWAVEVVPNPYKNLAFVVNAELQTNHGIHNHENMVFDELIADRKYQFVYVFTVVPIKGATGSIGSPIAVT